MDKRILKDYLPYIIPFLVFAGLTYILPLTGADDIFIYPAKTLIVFLVLFYFWKKIKEEIKFQVDFVAIGAGVFVFLVWVGLEGFYPLIGNDDYLNPFELSNKKFEIYLWISIRFLGGCLAVPIIEELFWRSFALRFLIDPDIKKIPVASFSWFSFIMVSVAFGFEHYRWLPGIIAGVVYALLYYRTKNLFSPVISHSVTNFLLGVYVLGTGQFGFW
ncbi:MAG: CAAX prenyl protease-related protein [Desulforegulaceae bacterium]|nr:CAAX prenyl protease-related protein [Desulforegulaceae bacterium]